MSELDLFAPPVTQADAVLRYLQAGYSLTSLQALTMFGCFRLADVVFKLRKRGYRIESTTVTVSGDKKIASYSLAR